MSPTSIDGEMNADLSYFSVDVQTPAEEVKASGRCHGIGKEFFVQAQSRFQTQLCQGIIDHHKLNETSSLIELVIFY